MNLCYTFSKVFMTHGCMVWIGGYLAGWHKLLGTVTSSSINWKVQPQNTIQHMKQSINRRIHKTHLTPGAVYGTVKSVAIETSGGVSSITRSWSEWFGGLVHGNASVLAGGAMVTFGIASMMGGRGGAFGALVACALGGVGCSYVAKAACGVPSEQYEALVAEVTQVEGLVQVNGRAVQKLGDHFRVQTIREWVHKVQMRFGSLQDTPADRRVARLWLSDELSKSDMRDSDSVMLIPVVLELCFIPNRGDIVAKGVKETRVSAILKDMCPRPLN